MVHIPMAIPKMAKTALIQFMNGFFSNKDKKDMKYISFIKFLLKYLYN